YPNNPGAIIWMLAYCESRYSTSYSRPFDIRMHSGMRNTLLGNTCGESHLHMLRFLDMFMNAYSGVPKMALIWMVELGHDGVESYYHTDDQFLDFFKRNEKHLSNSFLIFAGDHGPRYSGVSYLSMSFAVSFICFWKNYTRRVFLENMKTVFVPFLAPVFAINPK
ncbi:hypothetical protein GCK32_021779, partial [Trichostrongylus colubriformis]